MLDLHAVIIHVGTYYNPQTSSTFQDIGIDATNLTSLVMQIQGCMDVTVALSNQPNNFTDTYYVFVIGSNGNTVTNIRFVIKIIFINYNTF